MEFLKKEEKKKFSTPKEKFEHYNSSLLLFMNVNDVLLEEFVQKQEFDAMRAMENNKLAEQRLEIQKDIAGAKPGSYLKQAEDYAAMKNVSVSQAYKDLGFDKRGDLNEGVQLYLKTNKVAPAGNDLATLARSYEIDIAGIEDTTTVKNKIKEKGYDEVGYLTEILSNPNANVKPGNYVINNRVLNVDAYKNITPVF